MNKQQLAILSLLVIVGFGFLFIGFKIVGYITILIGSIALGQLLKKK